MGQNILGGQIILRTNYPGEGGQIIFGSDITKHSMAWHGMAMLCYSIYTAL